MAGVSPRTVAAGRNAGGIERRRVLRGAAIAGTAGLGYVALAACGGGTSGSSSGGGQAKVRAQAAQIPVNGGKIFADAKVVVTQPSEGEFKAFSAVCTHRGCTVGSVSDGIIQCPCHGSQYSIEDASVVGGPAPKPLPEFQVQVTDGTVTVNE